MVMVYFFLKHCFSQYNKFDPSVQLLQISANSTKMCQNEKMHTISFQYKDFEHLMYL